MGTCLTVIVVPEGMLFVSLLEDGEEGSLVVLVMEVGPPPSGFLSADSCCFLAKLLTMVDRFSWCVLVVVVVVVVVDACCCLSSLTAFSLSALVTMLTLISDLGLASFSAALMASVTSFLVISRTMFPMASLNSFFGGLSVFSGFLSGWSSRGFFSGGGLVTLSGWLFLASSVSELTGFDGGGGDFLEAKRLSNLSEVVFVLANNVVNEFFGGVFLIFSPEAGFSLASFGNGDSLGFLMPFSLLVLPEDSTVSALFTFRFRRFSNTLVFLKIR